MRAELVEALWPRIPVSNLRKQRVWMGAARLVDDLDARMAVPNVPGLPDSYVN